MGTVARESSEPKDNRVRESTGEVTLVAVGDIMLGDTPERTGSGVGSVIRQYGPRFPFTQIAGEIKGANIAFGNLESVVPGPDRWMKRRYPQIGMSSEAIDGLTYAGFNVVSLANNHAMQHGKEGVLRTIRLLDCQKIRSIGIEAPERQIHNCFVYEEGDVKVRLLGYNCRPPKYSRAPLYVQGDLNRIIDDIRCTRRKSDICVVSLHWGDEFVECPSPGQVRMAHAVLDAGAHLIIGHHPHIPQGIEQYGEGLVAYSLGNFVFDLRQRRFRKTMILKCRFSKSGIVDFEVRPVLINGLHQPEIARGSTSYRLLDEFARLSSMISPDGMVSNDEAAHAYERLVKRRVRQVRREKYLYYFAHMWRKNPRAFAANVLAAALRRLLKLRHK
jgi:poly-gamma-glutamate synthesis protein (capsule biosynthesis protein)